TEYLVATVVFGLVIGLGIAQAGTLRLTRRGEHALTKLKEKHKPLSSGSAWDGTGDAALGVALFGTVVLLGSEIAFLADWYPRPVATSSAGGGGASGGGTGGCSGGAGGCGGDGGGGGCGGGCGGCGGGGD